VHQARPTLSSYHALIFTVRVGKDQSPSEENTASEKSLNFANERARRNSRGTEEMLRAARKRMVLFLVV
jgi:hypothetical protein